MKLVGMLDSPYVRRVAVSLQLLGLRFEHRPLSVLRQFDEFSRLNPVVRVPTLVSEDGIVLMDSTLILDYAERLARPRSLMPPEPMAYQQALRCLGLALAAADKTVALFYERNLRPPEKQYAPWIERIEGQVRAAYAELEAELARQPLDVDAATLTQPLLSAAVFWHFTQRALPGLVPVEAHPALAALSARCEALPAFRAAPHGEAAVQLPG
ncbi:glutathione S-transferase [Azohydromonas sp. G-1-1-14]|uniref:Glutathione S-transferase n=1 Tax=Azohydromonas caseinilytica TaxID=2728836 RepID=A0A848FD04_9BURK|nr:glutathione S-transferase [Azohydromonas caseinilytica]NML16866.1 glutathione S-transferase [Azohydromonas caseinilytica]